MIKELLDNELPAFERDLREQQENYRSQSPPAPKPSAADRSSFQAYAAWIRRTFGIPYPEAAFRQEFESNPDGTVGKPITPPSVLQAIHAGERKYTKIPVPILDIYVAPQDLSPWYKGDPSALAAAESKDAAEAEAQAKVFANGVPSVRLVRVADASHYVYMSNEADVLRAVRTFISGLPSTTSDSR